MDADALKQLKAKGRYRTLNLPHGIDLASNDYLGLRDHPTLRAAAVQAIEDGISLGAGGSRLLRGHHTEHEALEKQAASFFGSQRALFFANGFQGNSAIFGTLPNRHDVILFDSLIHASVREAVQHSLAKHIRIPHNDINAFEDALKKHSASAKHIWIAVESLYSMDGDIAPLEQLHALSQKYNATLIIDEAHSTGIYGEKGKGLTHKIIEQHGHQGLITLHTCGKALGVSGGLVCAESDIIDYMINKARPFIYSTAPSPFQAYIVSEAIKLSTSEEGDKRRAHLMALCTHAQKHIGGYGTSIIPIILGSDESANTAAATLQNAGYDIRAIRPPTVPEGTARLRLSLNANLDIATLDAIFALLPNTEEQI